MTEAELIKAVRRHAEENYCLDGWDYLVECWDDSDIARAIAGAEHPSQAIDRCKRTVQMLDEQRSECRAAGDW